MTQHPDDTSALLWLAAEDYAGLWEAVWQLHTLHPDGEVSELRDRAEQIIRGLLDAGLVELYWCQEPYGDMSAIPADGAAAVLATPGVWEEPDAGATSVRVSATPAGEAAVTSRP